MVRMGVQTSISGPVLTGRGGGILENGVRAIVQDLVEQGEERISFMASPRPQGVYLSRAQGGRSTGHYRRNISGFVRRFTGIITDGGVVYGPWLEGTSARNQTTRFKGYAMFRRTRQWLQGRVQPTTRKHLPGIMRRLNGGAF